MVTRWLARTCAAAMIAGVPVMVGAQAPVGAAPSDPPLNAEDFEVLRVAVQRCWVTPAGLEDAAELRITLFVELGPDGRVVGSPKLMSPDTPENPQVRSVFEAARRAVLRCQGNGFDVPPDLHGRPRLLEIAFDPKGMLK